MLPSKIDQMKASHETGSEANFGFGHALMPSNLEMCPPKAAFFSFWMQPKCYLSCYVVAKASVFWGFCVCVCVCVCARVLLCS